MNLRLVERSSKFLAARTSRRGFLARTAVVGSALSVGPVSYVMRPGTAYAAVCRCGNAGCGCGSACCDGYTDFCCVVNGGKNSCPTGTVPGGWWKADGTAFCEGPRFYIDCNYPAGVSNCHCGNDDCNHRKVGCTFFRYGQCHQEIGSLGAIACRMVTCTPPWQIDGACTQVSATDQATANHTADCPSPTLDLAAIAAAFRRRFAMWLIRDSRSGGIYLYNGINARHLDGTELSVQQAMLAKWGLPNDVIDGQNYLIDRLRERGLILGGF